MLIILKVNDSVKNDMKAGQGLVAIIPNMIHQSQKEKNTYFLMSQKLKGRFYKILNVVLD